MTDALHLAAVAPAAVGSCCLATDRGRRAELAAGMAMTLAMLDVAVTQLLPAVVWAAVLLGGGMALAAVGRARPARAARSAHAPLGLIVTAALLLAGTAVGSQVATSTSHHAAPALMPIVVAGAVAYTGWSIVLAAGRGRRAVQRVGYGAMACSAALMGAALLH